MNTKDKGDLAEAAVIFRLKELGYTVLVPFGDNARYDLVYDDGRGLKRVQVKYGRYSDGCVKFDPKSSYQDSTGTVSRPYTEAEVDVFMVYSPETGCVYAVPIEDAPSTQMWLRVEEHDSKFASDDKSNWAEDYIL